MGAHEITRLLIAYSDGEVAALDSLLPRVYNELKRIAHRQLRRERAGHTLSTTALVHEAYVALAGQSALTAQNRLHFFAISARLMRNILVDHARERGAHKRGGDLVRMVLDDRDIAVEERAGELIALDQALDRLAAFDARQAQVVEYRFFGGMTLEETAQLLGVTSMTVSRDWQKAKAWLRRFLCEEEPSTAAAREAVT